MSSNEQSPSKKSILIQILVSLIIIGISLMFRFIPGIVLGIFWLLTSLLALIGVIGETSPQTGEVESTDSNEDIPPESLEEMVKELRKETTPPISQSTKTNTSKTTKKENEELLEEVEEETSGPSEIEKGYESTTKEEEISVEETFAPAQSLEEKFQKESLQSLEETKPQPIIVSEETKLEKISSHLPSRPSKFYELIEHYKDDPLKLAFIVNAILEKPYDEWKKIP